MPLINFPERPLAHAGKFRTSDDLFIFFIAIVYFSVTLFQVPQYEYLQILICNGNSLTTLAGVEHIKHLWKLDVGNNQVLKNCYSNTSFMIVFCSIARFEVFNIYHVL